MPQGTAFRVYQLAIGDNASGDAKQHSKDDDNMSFFDALQMTANINYTSERSKSSTDDTTIEITNLNLESRKKFQVTGATVMLRAGYDDVFDRSPSGDIVPNYDALPVIYVGSVLYSYTVKRGVDMVTVVHCSNDKVERATTKTSTSYAPGTKREAVINDLVKQMNMPILEVDTTPCKNLVYEGGISVYGRVADALTRICQENGLVWFTHNKQVRVTPIAAAPKNLAWEIHPYNVIDSVEGYYSQRQSKLKPKKAAAHPRGHKKPAAAKPLPEDTTVTKANGMKTTTKKGVRLKVHLDGRIKLGDNVKLVDTGADYEGQYKVIGITHSMDYRGGAWATELDLTVTGE